MAACSLVPRAAWAACTSATMLTRLTSRAVSQSAREVANPSSRYVAARLTTMSMPPCAATVPSTSAVSAASSVTSVRVKVTAPLPAGSAAARSSATA